MKREPASYGLVEIVLMLVMQGLDCKYLVVRFRASVSQDTNHQSIHLLLNPAKLISV